MKMSDIGRIIVAVVAVLTLTVAAHRSENGAWKVEVTSLISRWVFDESSVSDDNPQIEAPKQKKDPTD